MIGHALSGTHHSKRARPTITAFRSLAAGAPRHCLQGVYRKLTPNVWRKRKRENWSSLAVISRKGFPATGCAGFWLAGRLHAHALAAVGGREGCPAEAPSTQLERTGAGKPHGRFPQRIPLRRGGTNGLPGTTRRRRDCGGNTGRETSSPGQVNDALSYSSRSFWQDENRANAAGRNSGDPHPIGAVARSLPDLSERHRIDEGAPGRPAGLLAAAGHVAPVAGKDCRP